MLILTEKAKSCPLKQLPERYDEWYDTPLHNKVAYYSNEKKELICQHRRENIESSARIIAIPADCVIETPTKTIFAKQNKNIITRHAFHLEVNDTIDEIKHISLINETTPHASKVKQITIDDSGLDDVLKDAVSASQASNLWKWIALGMISTIVGIIVILGFTVYCLKRRSSTAGESQQERMELEVVPEEPIYVAQP